MSVVSNMLDDVNADTWRTLNTVYAVAELIVTVFHSCLL